MVGLHSNKISCRPFVEYHPVIGHRYVPNIEARIIHENGGYMIKTNNMGFRSDFDFKRDKDKNTLRIVLFGDSFTAGDGVSNKDRYSDIISKELDVEIYNFGLLHSGTDQQYLIFKEFVRDIEFDILMICPLVENIRRNLYKDLLNLTHDGQLFLRPKPFFELRDGSLVLNNVPVPRVNLFNPDTPDTSIDNGNNRYSFPLNVIYKTKKRLLPDLNTREISYSLFRQPIDLYPEYYKSDNYEWLLMKTILGNWIREAKAVSTLIVPIPWYLFIEEENKYFTEGYRERFKELEKIHGVKVCDPLTNMRRSSMEDIKKFTYRNDKHFTPLGNKVLAEAILPDLKKITDNLRNG